MEKIEKSNLKSVINPKIAEIGKAVISGGESCCDSPPVIDNENAPSNAFDTFKEYMRMAGKEGMIDRRSKILISIALSVAQRCRPCLVSHIKSAKASGITKTEIDEAAAIAVSFSGSPSFVMYNEVCGELYG